MTIQQAIKAVTAKQNLSSSQMINVMQQIMTGQATQAQIGGFLVGLQMKGETVTEIAAAARVMRELATSVTLDCEPLIDTCGTGGDGASTFNVSTASAFVVAAAGGNVAKHGNRSISSSSGSADLLEAAGVNLDISATHIAQCVQSTGVGFMFAQKHHGAMKHAIGARKELAVRTIFNLLGPLTNPANARHQVLGVYDRKWIEPMARVLKELGSEHVLVVHAEDGLDEISIGSDSYIAELKNGEISCYTIKPEDFGLERQAVDQLAVADAKESLAIIEAIFGRKAGPARDIVVLNAGAAIYAGDLTSTLMEGIAKAQTVIDNGAALQKMRDFIEITNTKDS